MSYQFYRRLVVLTLAVGSSDGAARQIASLIAGRLATTNSPIRLKIEVAGTEVVPHEPLPPARPILPSCLPMPAIFETAGPWW
jgi:hypothetical protein